jgi:hypothetical protein
VLVLLLQFHFASLSAHLQSLVPESERPRIALT